MYKVKQKGGNISMRVLFFECNEVFNTLLPSAFKDLGHEVEISGKLNEQKIAKLIHKFKPHLILSMGWGLCQSPIYQKCISKYAKKYKIPNVYWSLEDPAFTHLFVLPLIKALSPDFVFTICKSRVDYFKKLGIRAAYMDYGYNPKIHYREKKNRKYNCSIAIVANSYAHVLKDEPHSYRLQSIKTLIYPLLKQNIRIDFWGHDWEKMNPIIRCDIPNDWIHGYLPYSEATKVYSSADIVLGLQNHYTQLTQRTYEILGCEGFLLTADTLALRNLFKPGQDLIVSSSPQETLELVHYYLSRPENREKIRKQGKLAVSNYTYTQRAAYIIDTLKKEKILPKDIQ
ncbi:MAG: glycosyltransferase [Marinisporobacter sp.]|nr:glycosyltransferase [Marinisporobacter sp.]